MFLLKYKILLFNEFTNLNICECIESLLIVIIESTKFPSVV